MWHKSNKTGALTPVLRVMACRANFGALAASVLQVTLCAWKVQTTATGMDQE